MEFRWMVVIYFLQISLSIVSSDMVVNVSLSKQESFRKTNLQKLHAVTSIQSEDGDIIDCINIYKQPAFDHPTLMDHKIQLYPSNAIKTDAASSTKGKKMSVGRNVDTSRTVTTQLWQRSGSCPKGTIPIRRTQGNHVPNKDKIDGYGRKKPTVLHYDEKSNESKMLYLQQINHSLAILHTEGYAYLGAKGDIKVWNPSVESDDEYSTSQVALKSGPYYDYESMESGWAVNPSVYGDRQTRLFVYWTADASKETGCFDLTCPGFVQISNEIALGAAIYPISNPTGLPYQITIYIHKDSATNNWWVQYGERINIGYWPPKLFSALSHHAETVQWGGEVYSSRVGTHPHTGTGMGSGHFADYVSGDSGYVKRMRVLENNLILRFPQWVFSYTDEYDCYDTYYISDYVQDPEFYYGGPGRNPRCP
ncbi:protein neprosin-like [Primulina eburnea]|uniref:protein neprosin-like n=1 Tax=Primulina eburnea TaxID=1245227 RepID=UPI003C6C2684